jgi:hypothetical protein
MPSYDYRCTECGWLGMVVHSMDDTLVDLPHSEIEPEGECKGLLCKDYRNVRVMGFVGRHAIGLGRPTDRFWETGKLDHEP